MLNSLKITFIFFAFLVNINVFAQKKIKLAIIGSKGVGKTSLIEKLINSKFNDRIISTDKLNTYSYKTTLSLKDLQFEILDFPGTTHYFDFCKNKYHHNINAFVFIFDITQSDYLKELYEWDPIVSKANKRNIPIIVIGNKTDLKQENITLHKKHMTLIKNWKATYFQTSAKEETGLMLALNHIGPLPFVERLKDTNEIKSNYLSNYFFNEKKSHFDYFDHLTETELQNHIEYCKDFLSDLIDKKKWNLSILDYKIITFYMSLSISLSGISEDIYHLLYEKMNYPDYCYLKRILEQWHINIEMKYHFLNQKIDYYMEYIEMENDFQLLTNIVLQMAQSTPSLLSLKKTVEPYLKNFLLTSKNRVLNHLKYDDRVGKIGEDILIDILRESKLSNTTFYRHGGRFSCISDTICNMNSK